MTNPAGTAGCVTADVRLPRGAATVPGRVFLVIDRADGGAWSVVHLHVAAAAPSPPGARPQNRRGPARFGLGSARGCYMLRCL